MTDRTDGPQVAGAPSVRSVWMVKRLLCGATAPPDQMPQPKPLPEDGEQPSEPKLRRKLVNFCRTSVDPHSGQRRSVFSRKPWTNTSYSLPHSSHLKS